MREDNPRCITEGCKRPAHFHTVPTEVARNSGAQALDFCKAHLWHAFDRAFTVADPAGVIHYER